MAHREDDVTGGTSTPDDDLDRLCQVLVEFAQRTLAKHGEFHPFGAAIGTEGDVRIVSGYLGTELPSPHDVINHLTAAHKKEAAEGAIRAAGICVDIRTIPPGQTEKTDAVCVSLEHREGEASDFVVPYTRGWFRRLRFGEPFTFGRDPTFFVDDKPPEPQSSQ